MGIGDGLTDSRIFTAIFRKLEPLYLTYGMSRDEFWNGPPEAAIPYREAAKIRERQRNNENWLLGIYVLHALNTALVNNFSKKGSRKAEYLKEPLPLTMEEAEEMQVRQALEKEQRMKEWMFANARHK